MAGFRRAVAVSVTVRLRSWHLLRCASPRLASPRPPGLPVRFDNFATWCSSIDTQLLPLLDPLFYSNLPYFILSSSDQLHWTLPQSRFSQCVCLGQVSSQFLLVVKTKPTRVLCTNHLSLTPSLGALDLHEPATGIFVAPKVRLLGFLRCSFGGQ